MKYTDKKMSLFNNFLVVHQSIIYIKLNNHLCYSIY